VIHLETNDPILALLRRRDKAVEQELAQVTVQSLIREEANSFSGRL
jgi:hypothetical protein